MRRLLLASSILCALASQARAEWYGSDHPWQKHIELQVAFDMGGLEMGPFDSGFAVGGDISVVVPLTRKLGLRGEGRLSGFSESGYEIENPVGGIQTRLGAALRWRYWDINPDGFMRIGFYAEGGIGRHTVYWDEGGVISRNDFGGGLGMQLDFRSGKNKNEKSFGIFWEFQLTVASSPGKTGAPACQVICDEATPPYAWDFAPGFRMGFAHGF